MSGIGLEEFLIAHLRGGAPGSADPVEVARAFEAVQGAAQGPDDADPEAWRRHLSAVRRTALRLAEAGGIEILRKGKKVAPGEARGVIRLRIAP